MNSQDRALILNFLLSSVSTLPIKDIITYELDGTIRVAGKELAPDQMIAFREGAVALEKNWTYRTIKEQIAYEAIKLGIHGSIDMDGVMFSKAAIWLQQEEIKLVKRLSGDQE